VDNFYHLQRVCRGSLDSLAPLTGIQSSYAVHHICNNVPYPYSGLPRGRIDCTWNTAGVSGHTAWFWNLNNLTTLYAVLLHQFVYWPRSPFIFENTYWRRNYFSNILYRGQNITEWKELDNIGASGHSAEKSSAKTLRFKITRQKDMCPLAQQSLPRREFLRFPWRGYDVDLMSIAFGQGNRALSIRWKS